MHDINITTYTVTILYLPLEGGAVFMNNYYPMYACNFIQFIYLSVLYRLPFHTSIYSKYLYMVWEILIGQCAIAIAWSVEAVISQYVIQ